MNIVPDAQPSVTTSPDFAARMARVDGCPEACGNVQPPLEVQDDQPHGFIANYLCGSCGHAWSTGWGE